MAIKPNFNSNNRSMLIWLLCIFLPIFCLSFLSENLFILCFFGLLPSIIAIAVDIHPKRYLSQIILIFNILGLSNLLIKALSDFEQLDYFSNLIISNTNSWFAVYSFCGFGWIVYLIVPKLFEYFSTAIKKDLLKKYENDMSEIKKEWEEDRIGEVLDIKHNINKDDF
jgi:hypothetical protein